MPTVLVVDSEVAALGSCRSALESGGFTVITATTADEGKRLCVRVMPELLIADETLIDGDGLDFLRYCMSLSVRPVTLLTSLAVTPGLIAAAKHLGVWGVMEKPIWPAEVLGLIRTALNRSSK